MSRAVVLTTMAAGAALLGVGYLGRRAELRAQLTSGVIPIVTPYIDIEVAQGVLSVMERLPNDRVTVLLHTLGGCVTACVLIANALRQFRESTAVVPYMAISGGTLIALSATRLAMGGRASLSAVDPQIMGQRVKHLAESKDRPSIAGLAREYEVAMRSYVEDLLGAHLPAQRLGPAMALFMGDHAPHEWPIQRREVEDLGVAVAPAASKWATMVDAYQGRRW